MIVKFKIKMIVILFHVEAMKYTMMQKLPLRQYIIMSNINETILPFYKIVPGQI